MITQIKAFNLFVNLQAIFCLNCQNPVKVEVAQLDCCSGESTEAFGVEVTWVFKMEGRDYFTVSKIHKFSKTKKIQLGQTFLFDMGQLH